MPDTEIADPVPVVAVLLDAVSVDAAPVDELGVRRMAARLASVERACSDPAGPDVARVEALRALEELKSAAAAAQCLLAAGLDASVRAAHAAAGVAREEQGRGVAAQVALARRESAHRGGRHLGVAKALVHEMPHTFAALRAGVLSEWRATLLVRETACLTVADRATLDAEVCGDPATLEGVGDARLVALAKKVAYRLDPESVVRRRAKAESDRRVTIRPAPDTMVLLNALLPVVEGVAAYAALGLAADTARAGGDDRTRGQVMADTLVGAITGQGTAAPTASTDATSTEAGATSTDAASTGATTTRGGGGGGGPVVVVRLVMTDRALLAGDDEPAFIPGYGPVPADLAREVLARAQDQVWLKRLFTDPGTGELVAMDSRARRFPEALRELLVLRDQTCRTPWCDAPIRHLDHATPAAAHGGPTSAANGQGLCERCNYDKQAPGWTTSPHPDSRPGGHLIETTTPTGHTYLSRPPPLPGAA